MTRPYEQAIAHITRLAEGGAVDPAWRMTVYFHPAWLSGGAETRTRVLGAQHPSTRGSLDE